MQSDYIISPLLAKYYFLCCILVGCNGSCISPFFILFLRVFKKSIREHLKTNNITIVILNIKKREENVDVIILQHSHQILEPIPTTYRFFVRSFQILFVVD